MTCNRIYRLRDPEFPWYEADGSGSHKLSLRDGEDEWSRKPWSYEAGVWVEMFRLDDPAMYVSNWTPQDVFEY
jgi:hypothetical protein